MFREARADGGALGERKRKLVAVRVVAVEVEAGDLASAATRELVARYTKPLVDRGADTIVLGCTHYPFLKPLIAEIVGPRVHLIDTGEAVARQVVRRLPEALIGRIALKPTERFWTTGDARSATRIIGRLWGRAVEVEALELRYWSVMVATFEKVLSASVELNAVTTK